MLAIASSDLCRRSRLLQWSDESGDMVPSEGEAQLRKEAVAWVIRLHRGGLSPEDRRIFDAWHAQSQAHAQAFQKIFAVWDSAELRAAAAVVAAEPSSFTTRLCSISAVKVGAGGVADSSVIVTAESRK